MNKHDVVEKIAEDAGITKTTAALRSLIDAVTKSPKKGDRVSFVGFGTFKTASRRRARAESADRRDDQDSEAPRAPLLGRQGSQAGGPLSPTTIGEWVTPDPFLVILTVRLRPVFHDVGA